MHVQTFVMPGETCVMHIQTCVMHVRTFMMPEETCVVHVQTCVMPAEIFVMHIQSLRGTSSLTGN